MNDCRFGVSLVNYPDPDPDPPLFIIQCLGDAVFSPFKVHVSVRRDGYWKSLKYRNDPKFLDLYAWANSADPDQTAQGLHCLQFRLHRLDSLLYGRAT